MKAFWRSRVFWVNLLMFTAMALGIVLDFPDARQYAPYLTLALALVNLGLRFLTSQPIGLTAGEVLPPGTVDLDRAGEVTQEPTPNGPAIIERHDPVPPIPGLNTEREP